MLALSSELQKKDSELASVREQLAQQLQALVVAAGARQAGSLRTA